MAPIALGVAVAAAYRAAFPGAWLYDDALAITRNGSLHALASAFQPPANGSPVTGRPLLNASFAVDWALAGNRPAVYLWTNLAIHWLAACALWGVLRRTFRNVEATPSSLQLPGSAAERPSVRALRRRQGNEATRASLLRAEGLAFMIALGWAVHPLCTSAVAYLSQRAESLAALCCLFALYCLARGWRWSAVGVCAAGMAVKETMVALPVILWLYDGAFLAGSPRAALRRRPGFHAGLAATWVVLAAVVVHEGSRNGTAGFGSGVSAMRYAAVQGAAVLHYLRLVIVPHPLLFLYPRTVAPGAWDYAADGICLALVAASVLAYVRGPRAAGFLGLAFFLWLAPSSSILPISTEIWAEHRMYLPLAAALSLLAAAVSSCYTGSSAWPRQARRQKGEPQVEDARLHRGSVFSRLGAYLHGGGRSSPGVASDPTSCEHESLRSRRGGCLQGASLGVPQEVRGWAKGRKVAVAVGAGLLVGAWAVVTGVRARDYSGAVRMWSATARGSPADPLVWNNLGTSRLDAGQAAEALPDFDRALALRPGYAEGHLNRGLALVALDRMNEAAAEFEAALRISPSYAKARQNAGQAWLLLGNRAAHARRRDEAITDFRRAVEFTPDNADAHGNLGTALAAAGDYAAAVRELEVAVAGVPEDGVLRHNLAAVRERLAGANHP